MNHASVTVVPVTVQQEWMSQN